MPDEKKPRSWMDYPELAEAHINPKMSWFTYHFLADFVSSLVTKKVRVFPEGEKRAEMLKSLEGKQIIHSFSHTGFPDPPLIFYHLKELHLRNPLLLMTDDLGKGPLVKVMKSVGAVEVKREISADGVVRKITEVREGGQYLLQLNDFAKAKLIDGYDLAYSPAAQRSTNGLIDDSFGNKFGGILPRSAEEFIKETSKPLMLLTTAITYDFIPDIFEQEKRIKLGHRLSRNEFKVDFGFAERDGDGYKTGKLVFLKGVAGRLLNPGSRPYGNAYVNISPPVDLVQLLTNSEKKGRVLIADAMHASMLEAVMLPPSTIISYSLLQAGGSASKQQLEEIVGQTTEKLRSAHVPLAPTVKKEPSKTIDYARRLLEENRVIIPYKESFTVGNNFACQYLANIGRYHFNKIK